MCGGGGGVQIAKQKRFLQTFQINAIYELPNYYDTREHINGVLGYLDGHHMCIPITVLFSPRPKEL